MGLSLRLSRPSDLKCPKNALLFCILANVLANKMALFLFAKNLKTSGDMFEGIDNSYYIVQP